MHKKTKNSMKRAGSMIAALAMTFSGASGVIPFAAETVMVASAAENVEVNPSTFGMVTPAGGKVVRNGKILKTFSQADFQTAFTVSADENTELVLNYDDGDLVFNLLTKELKKNTRVSGVARETFKIDVTKGYGKTGSHLIANGPSTSTYFRIITTERNPETGDKGKVVSALNLPKEDGKYSGADLYETTGPGQTELKYTELEYKYVPGEDIFISVVAGGGNGLLMKYNVETGEVISSCSSMTPQQIVLNMDMFPRAAGAKTMKMYGSFIKNANTDYGETDTDENGTYTKFDMEELKTGECKITYMFNVSAPLYSGARLQFEMEDGEVEYLLLGDMPVLNKDTRKINEFVIDSSKGGAADPVKDATEAESGKPVLSKDILGTEPRESSYAVEIYEGARLYDTIAGVAFEKGEYCIKGYDPTKNYYVKVDLDENGDNAEWFKLKPVKSEGEQKFTWEKRINTKETPTYEIPINMSAFQNEFAEGTAVMLPDSVKEKWTTEEYAAGEKKLPFETQNGMYYKVNFKYPDGTNTYTIIGIDPELESEGSEGTKNDANFSTVPIEADPGDVIKVTGKGYVGTPPKPVDVAVEYIVPEKIEGIPAPDGIRLPVGDYVFADETTGLKDSVNTTENKDVEAPNLSVPIKENNYEVSYPDGKKLEAGAVADGAFDSKEDMTNPDALDKGVYWEYTYDNCIKNAIEDKDAIHENAYFSVNDDGTFNKIAKDSVLRGDVNLDGSVDVKDVILLQKYLIGNASFKVENFINADMNSDGEADVFDLGLLKRELLKK